MPITKGDAFGRLTVVSFAGHTTAARPKRKYLCRCNCGVEVEVVGEYLRGGHTRSCGCLQVEESRERHTTHGESRRTRLYRIWANMLTRCSNPNVDAWDDYGGRGIVVCSEWHEFVAFRDWANANGYADDLTIDRENNDGNYEPSNCRWIPSAEQAANRRNNRTVVVNGEPMNAAAASRATGVPYHTIISRLNRGVAADAVALVH